MKQRILLLTGEFVIAALEFYYLFSIYHFIVECSRLFQIQHLKTHPYNTTLNPLKQKYQLFFLQLKTLVIGALYIWVMIISQIYQLLTQQMSIKDRIAQFEGLSKSPGQNPTLPKPIQIPKNTPPPQVVQPKPPISSPSTATNTNTLEGSVQSDSIAKISSMKQAWEAKVAGNNSPKKQAPSPVPKTNKVWPPPASNTTTQSSKPSVEVPQVKKNAVWPPPSTSNQSKEIAKPASIVNNESPVPSWVKSQPQSKPKEEQKKPVVDVPSKQNKVWPPPTENASKPAEKPLVTTQPSLSQSALKKMFEGKGMMGITSRMSFPVQSNSIIHTVEEDRTSKEAPVVGHVDTGNVKGNTQKLNKFFQAQRQYEKEKAEEQAKRKEEIRKNAEKATFNQPKQDQSPPQVKPSNPPANYQPASSEISFLPGPTPGPSVVSPPSPGPKEVKQPVVVGGGQEENIMVRLKKKKRAKVHFSSDSD